jgi:Secretion system C-terminal sorting domain
MALIFCASKGYVNAQCGLLTNGSFTSFCGTQTSVCPTFSNPCLANWSRSHGTPTWVGGTDPYLFMFSGLGEGEGVFASFNFVASTSYILKIRAQASGTQGNFQAYATSGLIEPPVPTASCGSVVPSIPNKQIITTQSPTPGGGWQDYEVLFTPTQNFTQLWIFPQQSASGQYDFYIDYIDLCFANCSNQTVVFNTGQIPTGKTAAKNIYVGSTAGAGGSGTVTVNPTASTDLVGGSGLDGIIIKNEFRAVVSTGRFRALIATCPSNGAAMASKVGSSNENDLPLVDLTLGSRELLFDLRRDSMLLLYQPKDFTVYPSPTNGIVEVKGKLSDLENATFVVINLSGKEVYRKQNSSNFSLVKLNLTDLPNGIYFLKISANGQIVTKKIIVSR